METNNSSGWAIPLVVVPKAYGKVRLAADYRVTVNPQLDIIKHPLPSPEDLFARIRGKRFAKLDLRDAYLQMELSEKSKDLTTITTHRGLLRKNRLSFGLACCGEIFQAAMDRILEGLPKCVAYLDDLLVMGCSAEDLLDNLDKELGRLKDNGIWLKKTKFEFNLQEVQYLGWIVTSTELNTREN